MRAAILSIGSEIMLGQITDTNASWLARDLAAHGIELVQVTQVGDNRHRLIRAMRSSLVLADIVICTGGIGPTDDDLTRETIAELVGETPEVNAELLEGINAYFAELGRTMTKSNAKQAWLIPSAEPISNPVGTAPGWYVRINGEPSGIILTMPGVPREMERMWIEQMRPRILANGDLQIIDTVLIKTLGIGESACEEAIHDLIALHEPEVATYAKDDGVHVRITTHGVDADDCRARRDTVADEVRSRLADYIWGEDDDTLAGKVADHIRLRGDSLVLHEIGTGGALAGILSSDPAAADVFQIDIVEPLRSHEPTDLSHEIDIEVPAGSISVTLRFSGQPNESKIVHGTLTMSIADESHEPHTRSWPLRGSLLDIQRRSAQQGVNELLAWLRGSHPTTA